MDGSSIAMVLLAASIVAVLVAIRSARLRCRSFRPDQRQVERWRDQNLPRSMGDMAGL